MPPSVCLTNATVLHSFHVGRGGPHIRLLHRQRLSAAHDGQTARGSMTARRFIFLDVLRGIAVLWMIQTHVTNQILDPALRTTAWFQYLNISNGFVAPCFIFCAGAGLWIALSRKGDAYLGMGRELGVYLRRLAYILFIAYFMHVPVFSLQWLLGASAAQLTPWLMIDVLQTIVYSSLATLLAFLLIRHLAATAWTCAALSVLVMFCTLFVWQTQPLTYLPLPLAVAITPDISPFSLLPWSCYFFAGFFITHLFMRAKNQRRLAVWFLVGGIGVPFVLFAIKDVVYTPWDMTWWSTSPQLALFRISGSVALWGLLFLKEEQLQASPVGKLMQTIGTESLFMYLSHVAIVYGALAGLMSAITGNATTNYAGVALTFVLLTVPLVFLMLWWHRLKKNKPVLARRLLIVQVVWMVISLAATPAEFALRELMGK